MPRYTASDITISFQWGEKMCGASSAMAECGPRMKKPALFWSAGFLDQA
jgi:hypothetical protein